MRLKKTVQYTTRDGKTFTKRKDALAHEIHVIRMENVVNFLNARLKDTVIEEELKSRLADVISKNANEFALAISARAARTLGDLPGPKHTGPLRPRGPRKQQGSQPAPLFTRRRTATPATV